MLSDALLIGGSEITFPFGTIPNSTDSVSSRSYSFPVSSISITHFQYVLSSMFVSWIFILNLTPKMDIVFLALTLGVDDFSKQIFWFETYLTIL